MAFDLSSLEEADASSWHNAHACVLHLWLKTVAFTVISEILKQPSVSQLPICQFTCWTPDLNFMFIFHDFKSNCLFCWLICSFSCGCFVISYSFQSFMFTVIIGQGVSIVRMGYPTASKKYFQEYVSKNHLTDFGFLLNESSKEQLRLNN